MKIRHRNILLSLAVLGILLSAAVPAHAIKLFGVDLTCDPAKAPNAGGCGAEEFLKLVRGVILQILNILFIVVPVLIAFGGIMIMTAAGSESRVTLGKRIITAAVVGLAIGLGSALIIQAIYIALKGSGGTPPVPVQGVTIPFE